MSENSQENPEKFSGKSETIITGRGISYSQIPRNLFKISAFENITSSDVLMALSLFDYCHGKRLFPKFTLSHSEIAKIANCSRRQSMYGMQRLIDLRLFSVKNNGNLAMQYQWNEQFLITGKFHSAKLSPDEVKNFHRGGENASPEVVKDLHHVYIEFILDYIYILYKGYFESQASLLKRVPGKREQKGVPQGSGTVLFVSRKEAWRDAVTHAYKKCGDWGRIYSALAGGFHIDGVSHPRAYLSKLIWDESHLYESRKKSNLYQQGHLDDDLSFLKFIRSREREGDYGNECSEIH